MVIQPVVYVGPSIARERVLALLPNALIKPPIERGDLYQDRMLFYSVFIIIDGVFFHGNAVSPRECVDVCRDGATVIGASSMGALRAAECAPAGMLGAGAIFRMFRAGWLVSDDEVAMTFDPDDPQRALSLPLVNVRHAVSRAIRARVLDRESAARIVAGAAALYYPDRRWSTILSAAGLPHRRHELEAFFKPFDLKKEDAERALRTAAHLMARDPDLGGTRKRRHSSFALTESTREAELLRPFRSEVPGAREEILRWSVVTGEYRSLLDASAVSRTRSERLPMDLDSTLEACLWASILASPASLYRWRAHQLGLARAHSSRILPLADDLSRAGQELAVRHGFRSWEELDSELAGDGPRRAALLKVQHELATLRALRRCEGRS